MIRFLSLAVCVAYLSPAMASIYSYTNEQGQTVFTDNPPEGINAKPLTINPTNSTPMPLPTRKLLPPEQIQLELHNAQIKALTYQVVEVQTPEPNETIRANEGRLSVMVRSDPTLHEGHFFRLLLDNEPVAEPQNNPLFHLEEVDRGSHKLAVEVVDAFDKVIKKSAEQTFHLRRTTLSDRKRIRPCEPEDYGVRLECPIEDKPKPDPFYKRIPVIKKLFKTQVQDKL